jgi:hypothetical protein
MRIISITILLLTSFSGFAQQFKPVKNEDVKANYEKAFLEIKGMLEGTTETNFKKAVT